MFLGTGLELLNFGSYPVSASGDENASFFERF
jgi:hypothetical protein